MELEQAVKLMMTKSPDCIEQGMGVLAAIRVSSPVLAQRYQRLAQEAFRNIEAYTSEERSAIIALLDVEQSENRDQRLQVRVSRAEVEHLQAQSEAAGVNVSEYVRNKIFG